MTEPDITEEMEIPTAALVAAIVAFLALAGLAILAFVLKFG